MPGLDLVGDTVLVAPGSHGKFLSRLDIATQPRHGDGHPHPADAVFSDAIAPTRTWPRWSRNECAYAAELAREIGRTESLSCSGAVTQAAPSTTDLRGDLAERDAEIALSPASAGQRCCPNTPIT